MGVKNDCLQCLDKAEEEVKKSREKFAYNNKSLLDKAHKIFKDYNFTENDVRFKCYAEMIKKLDAIENPADGSEIKDDVKKELCKLAPLLRRTWRKYENELRVHEYKTKKGVSYCDYENENGARVHGVYINLEYAMEDLDWIASYHYIFHEFFHIVSGAADRDVGLDGIMLEFGRSIACDVDKLLEEENDNSVATKKRLNNLTYKTDKKHKAVLYDLIGAVLYRGKYGCYPPNSEFYNGGKKCKNENGCKLETNIDCNKIFGHNIDPNGNKYWGKKTSPPTQEFLQKLALEAFAQMAAEAIVNPKAYEKIMECLPESCKIFRKVLKEILSEELKFLRNILWLN